MELERKFENIFGGSMFLKIPFYCWSMFKGPGHCATIQNSVAIYFLLEGISCYKLVRSAVK